MVWEVLVSVGFGGAELLLQLASQLAVIWPPPPPCPSDGMFPQDVIRWGVSVARSIAWGQPCP